MLEIIALVYLTRIIGPLAEQKGLKSSTWKLYTVLAWFAGEIIGIFIGLALFGSENMLMSILVAIPCAIGGYHIIRNRLHRMPDIYRDDIEHLGDNLVQ